MVAEVFRLAMAVAVLAVVVVNEEAVLKRLVAVIGSASKRPEAAWAGCCGLIADIWRWIGKRWSWRRWTWIGWA